MKSLIKKIFQGGRAASLSDREKSTYLEAFESTRAQQIQLMLQYRSLLQKKEPLPDFDDIELRVFSENGEDGILLFIFALIGAKNKVLVELGCGDGTQCNTANLLINHGWTGLLVDGDQSSVQYAEWFYNNHPCTRNWPPTIRKAWITRDSIDKLFQENNIKGEIDLLTIDLDGMDYWIWQSIHFIQPRVVMLEIQDIWGSERAVTIPYSDEFNQTRTGYGFDYCGASLPAMVKLGNQKGYRLVGVQRYGYNAFFIRDDIARDILPEVQAGDCFWHPRHHLEAPERLARVKDLIWEDV